MKNFFQGVKAAIPITIGFIPTAMAFGILAEAAGFSPMATLLMSVLVFAGASQFMAIGMLTAGAAALPIIVATFAVNFRMFIMSFTIMQKTKAFPLRKRFLLFPFVTDETFAVVTLSKNPAINSLSGLFGLHLLTYLSWVLGTFLGIWLYEATPAALSKGMSVALYAMFIALLIPALKVEKKYIWVCLIAIAVYLLVAPFVGRNWSLILATLLAPSLYLLLQGVHARVSV